MKAMRKTLQSETGAVLVVEVALLVAVLALAGFVAYRGYQARQTTSQLSKPAVYQAKQSPSPSATPSPDLTASWKTYTLSGTSVSFKYPADWKVAEDTVVTAGGSKAHYTRLQSPGTQTGNFKDHFYLGFYKTDLTYRDTAPRKVMSVQRTRVNGKDAFIVDTAADANTNLVSQVILVGSTATVGQTQGVQYYVASENAELSMYGGYGMQAVAVEVPVAQWDKLPEVQTAKQIMGTLRY